MQINQNQPQTLGVWEFPNKDIEKYIHQTHKEFPTDIIESAKRCMAGTSPRAESEYNLCISRISEYYNKLLAAVDFKLQIAYKIVATRKSLEEIQCTEKDRHTQILNLQARRQHLSMQEKDNKINNAGLVLGLASVIGLFAAKQFSPSHVIALAITGMFALPLLLQRIDGQQAASKPAGSGLSLAYKKQDPHQINLKTQQDRKRKLVGYAVSLERLITRMYHSTLRLFQMEYVFSHPKEELPMNFSVAPPKLHYVYRPLLANWAERSSFCF